MPCDWLHKPLSISSFVRSFLYFNKYRSCVACNPLANTSLSQSTIDLFSRLCYWRMLGPFFVNKEYIALQSQTPHIIVISWCTQMNQSRLETFSKYDLCALVNVIRLMPCLTAYHLNSRAFDTVYEMLRLVNFMKHVTF